MSAISSLVDSLPNSADKQQTLNDIRTCLVSTSQSLLKDVVPNISFNVIFDILQTNNREEIELCCVVLDGLLSACDPLTLIHQFHDHLLQGLCHSDEKVRLLCLKQVLSACKSSSQQVAAYTNVVCQLVKIVGEKNLSVAQHSMDILSILGTATEGLESLFKGPAFVKFQEVMELGDEIRYRLYQVLINIAKVSRENLQACEECGLMQKVLNEIHTDDILVQLNAIELLTSLACTQHGLLYLDQKGVVSKLDQMLQTSETNPLGDFLMPGLLKFFGQIAHQQPEEMSGRLKPFIDTVFSQVQSQNVSIKVVAIETLAHVGSLSDGKKALDKQGAVMVSACREIGDTLNNTQSEMRVRLMDAISELLHLRVSDQTQELLGIAESWYSNLSTRNTLDFIMKQCQQPFLQLRCSGFTFLRILANQPWGQRNLNNYAAFHEYILDRKTETTKEGKDGKFDIVKTLVDSPTAVDIFGRVYFIKLREYYNDGPYYVKAESSVAFEGDS